MIKNVQSLLSDYADIDPGHCDVNPLDTEEYENTFKLLTTLEAMASKNISEEDLCPLIKSCEQIEIFLRLEVFNESIQHYPIWGMLYMQIVATKKKCDEINYAWQQKKSAAITKELQTKIEKLEENKLTTQAVTDLSPAAFSTCCEI